MYVKFERNFFGPFFKFSVKALAYVCGCALCFCRKHWRTWLNQRSTQRPGAYWTQWSLKDDVLLRCTTKISIPFVRPCLGTREQSESVGLHAITSVSSNNVPPVHMLSSLQTDPRPVKLTPCVVFSCVRFQNKKCDLLAYESVFISTRYLVWALPYCLLKQV